MNIIGKYIVVYTYSIAKYILIYSIAKYILMYSIAKYKVVYSIASIILFSVNNFP